MKKKKNADKVAFEEVLRWIEYYPELSIYITRVPPGHYYSPIPLKSDILKKKDALYDEKKPYFGIDLNEEKQIKFLFLLGELLSENSFQENPSIGNRYYFNNGWFPISDAILLRTFLCYFQPNKIIEIGSGYSSAVILDTREFFIKKDIEVTFIEPNPKRLMNLLKDGDKKSVSIMKSFVQEIDINIFLQLQSNDILFIDSSHVTKAGSDVNYIFFEVLPQLKKGVIIHLHDIFHNFEYPLDWLLEGRSWNESYLLKAFLQYNSNFEIILFHSFLEKHYKDLLQSNFPDLLTKGSGSFWMRKLT